MSTKELIDVLSPCAPNVPITLTKDDLLEFARLLLSGQADNSTSGWMNADQVSKKFGIPLSNIRNARWRRENNFPTHQPGGAYCKPYFIGTEVSEWIAQYH